MPPARKTISGVLRILPLPLVQKHLMNPEAPCHFRNRTPALYNLPYSLPLELTVELPPAASSLHLHTSITGMILSVTLEMVAGETSMPYISSMWPDMSE